MTRALTRVPDAIDALLGIAQLAAARLEQSTSGTITVYDSAPTVPVEQLDDDVVVVGGNAGEQTAVSGSQSGPNGLGYNDEETFQVRLTISSIRDVGEAKAARDRVSAVLGAIAAQLRTDPRLGGAVGYARLGPSFLWSAMKVARGEGEAIEVDWVGDIECKALL